MELGIYLEFGAWDLEFQGAMTAPLPCLLPCFFINIEPRSLLFLVTRYASLVTVFRDDPRDQVDVVRVNGGEADVLHAVGDQVIVGWQFFKRDQIAVLPVADLQLDDQLGAPNLEGACSGAS